MNFKFAIKDLDKFKESVDFLTDRDFVISLKLKHGQYVNAETWKDRNIMFHRKFFAFLNAAIYLFPEDKRYDPLRNIDYLRKKLMIMTGNVDSIYDMEGREHMQAKSISFKSMDDETFDKLYKDCITAVLNNFLHDISIKDFETTIEGFI